MSKLIFGLFSLLAIVFLGYLISQNPIFILGILICLFLILCLMQNFYFGFFLIFSLIVFGQLLRLPLPFFEERALLAPDVFIPVLIVFWFLNKLIKKEKFKQTIFSWPIFIFIFIAVFSELMAFKQFPLSASLVAIFYLLRLISYSLLFFVVFDLVNDQKRFNWFLKGVLVTGLLIALLGLFQLRFLPDWSFMVAYGWDPHFQRVLSTFFDPNFVGGFLMLIFSLLLSLFLFVPGLNKKFGYLVLIFPILLAIIFTFSRSTYLGLLASFLVLGLLKSRKLLLIGILAGLLIFFTIPRVSQRIISARGLDVTTLARLKSWRNALTIFQDHPLLGVGYNNYAHVQFEYGFVERTSGHAVSGSDSSFLTILTTTGIFGFLSYLLIYLLMLYTSFRIFLTKKYSLPLRALGLGFLAGLLGLLIHSQFVNSLLYPYIMILIWVLLGLLSAGQRIEEQMILETAKGQK